MHTGGGNNDDTLDFPTTVLTKELKNFKSTVFFFIRKFL